MGRASRRTAQLALPAVGCVDVPSLVGISGSVKQKIIITVNAAWNLVTFRAGLIRALMLDGFEVVAVAPTDRHAARLAPIGCRFLHIPMDNQGTNPFRD